MADATAVSVGGLFERRANWIARLQQGPGEEAHREVAVTPSGPPPSRWTLRTIRVSFPEFAAYTLSGVWRALRRFDLCLRSARVQQYSPDPDYAAKEERLLAGLREATAAPGEVVVLFWDEMGFFRWPEPATDWGPTAPLPPPVAQRSATNNQQWRILGALNALTGQVNYLDNYIVGREKVIAMYRTLDQVYPDARRIYVAQDNWSIHRHPDVLAALEVLSRLEPLWLPTYAPWLNPIEKLWRWLRQDVLKLHRRADEWATLRATVRDFLSQFAHGSAELLRYVGLTGEGKLAQALQ